MYKAIFGFALSRRAIVLLGLIVFIAGGLIAYSKLNIEAYPNPPPALLELPARAPGFPPQRWEKNYPPPWRSDSIRHLGSTTFARLRFMACRSCASPSNTASI